jgi:hypothetical protein
LITTAQRKFGLFSLLLERNNNCNNGIRVFYSGVDIKKRAGVTFLVNKSWKNKINSYTLINERIMTIRLKLERGYLTLFNRYAPEEGTERRNN